MAAAAAAADMAAALEEARLRQLDSEEARQVAEALILSLYLLLCHGKGGGLYFWNSIDGRAADVQSSQRG